MGAISAAYGDLQQPAIMNNKNIDDQRPARTTWADHAGRLRTAEALLNRAHDDLEQEEDNPAARGLRDRAIHRVDDAGRLTDWGF